MHQENTMDMEIKVEISNITHEDLVNLLSTTLYGSPTFVGRLLEECEGLETSEEFPSKCVEDKMANVLLYGGEICIIDVDGGEIFKNKGVFSRLTDDDEGEYHFGLEAVKKGLKKALESKENYIRLAAFNFLVDDGTFDASDAEVLIQMILFGEVIYG